VRRPGRRRGRRAGRPCPYSDIASPSWTTTRRTGPSRCQRCDGKPPPTERRSAPLDTPDSAPPPADL
jgi:hypothetical protein